MLQHQIVAYLDKGLLNADAGNIEQASQYYRKGKRILIAFHAQKYKILSTGIPNSAMTIPSTPLSIASTISTPKKPKIIGRKRLIS